MEKEFEEYLHNTRNEFVDAVNTYVSNKRFRVKCEDILIAFDQMKWKLRESQNLSKSDEALHIGNVVGRSEQLKADDEPIIKGEQYVADYVSKHGKDLTSL